MSSLRSSDGTIRDDFDKIQPEDGEQDIHGPARVSAWYQTSFNLMAEIMGEHARLHARTPPSHPPTRSLRRILTRLLLRGAGTGILSLPSTMAGLGYVLGSISLVVFSVAIYYSGFVLARVKNRYYKHVLSYGDVAFVLVRKKTHACTHPPTHACLPLFPLRTVRCQLTRRMAFACNASSTAVGLSSGCVGSSLPTGTSSCATMF